MMSTVTCPKCGHQLELEQKIIHLRRELHFGLDLDLFRAALHRAWRDSGAAHTDHTSAKISTREIASAVGFSEKHCLRGLKILEENGEVRKVGTKAGWKVVRFVRSAV